MASRGFTRACVVTAGIGLAAVLSGCGASPSAGPSTVTMTPVAAMQKVAASARQMRGETYTFAVTGPMGLSISGHGAYSTKPALAVEMAFDSIGFLGGAAPGHQGMEERILGDVVYLRMPGAALITGGSAKWMKISASAAGSAAGIDLGDLLNRSAQADPGQQLQSLLSVPNVHAVGKERLDGVDTTHYAGELSADDIARNPAYNERTREQLRKLYAGAGMTTTHVDVWIDGDYRARKFISSTPTSAGEVHTTMTFGGHDQPVSISAPDPADVVDLSGFTGGGVRVDTAPTGSSTRA